MSRAFVRESDADPGPLPDRPISPHPNFVTRRASARLVEPTAADRVRFGMLVTLRLASGTSHAFRLVGEDEADATPRPHQLDGAARTGTARPRGGRERLFSGRRG